MPTLSNEMRLADIKRFYEILDRLESECGGKRLLANCHGRKHWPKRGIYFFFEPGEMRTTSGNGMRVVRVGTHALKKGSKNTLWNRLSQHQGTQKTGGGNHRGSVFRLHIGTALINRDSWHESVADTWSKGSNAPKEIRVAEKPLERAVSQHIRSMPFLWIKVDDKPSPNSLRGYIERNSIALLSNFGSSDDNGVGLNSINSIDPPSSGWLGRYAKSDEIRCSGLWNVKHIKVSYDRNILHIITDIIGDCECE